MGPCFTTNSVLPAETNAKTSGIIKLSRAYLPTFVLRRRLLLSVIMENKIRSSTRLSANRLVSLVYFVFDDVYGSSAGNRRRRKNKNHASMLTHVRERDHFQIHMRFHV